MSSGSQHLFPSQGAPATARQIRIGEKHHCRYIFPSNCHCHGYRRIDRVLRGQGVRTSEKVVRRLMSEQRLIVESRHRRRFSHATGTKKPTDARPGGQVQAGAGTETTGKNKGVRAVF
ncbi:IS3 family transposase [Pantoea sp. 18069]|uniref:IS3 family transposase n=1 Tax=Pantoea sp. 18069 TaxID=2681415 RepID=UPI00135760F8